MHEDNHDMHTELCEWYIKRQADDNFYTIILQSYETTFKWKSEQVQLYLLVFWESTFDVDWTECSWRDSVGGNHCWCSYWILHFYLTVTAENYGLWSDDRTALQSSNGTTMVGVNMVTRWWTPYYGLRTSLNITYGKWIGRYGTTEWPALSPYLSPMDFLVWGIIKNSLLTENLGSEAFKGTHWLWIRTIVVQ